MRIDRERRPRVYNLSAWLQQDLASSQQDVAGAVTYGDHRRWDFVALAQALAQLGVGRVGVSVERLQRVADGLAYSWKRLHIWRLVASKQRGTRRTFLG